MVARDCLLEHAVFSRVLFPPSLAAGETEVTDRDLRCTETENIITEIGPFFCDSKGNRMGTRYLELGAGKPLIHFSVFNQVFQFFDFKSDFL